MPARFFEFWTSSFNSLLGLKNAILLAGTLTAAPVLGLRPIRASFARVEATEPHGVHGFIITPS